MTLTIDGMNINYLDYGTGIKTLVFLHGWGQNIDMMRSLANPFQKDYRIIIIDLPGFGHSDEPTKIYTVYDYAECVNQMLIKLKAKNIIMVGHSFGGKITLVYASKYKVDKIMLLASPYKKEIEKLSLKTKVLKGLKKVPGLNKIADIAKKYIGSTDYKKATPMMREILVNTVNLDITADVKKIKIPSLIIWGTLDEAVPYEDGIALEKLISDAGLVTYDGCSHYAYLERLNQTINILKTFIEEK